MYIPAQFRFLHYNADCRDWVNCMPMPSPIATATAAAAAAVIIQWMCCMHTLRNVGL
jgi:hypothetical protein